VRSSRLALDPITTAHLRSEPYPWATIHGPRARWCAASAGLQPFRWSPRGIRGAGAALNDSAAQVRATAGRIERAGRWLCAISHSTRAGEATYLSMSRRRKYCCLTGYFTHRERPLPSSVTGNTTVVGTIPHFPLAARQCHQSQHQAAAPPGDDRRDRHRDLGHAETA
jgi:hypothetical protein